MLEPTQSTVESFDLTHTYPASYASAIESQVIRSRTWNEEITKHWNVSITGLETFSERANRYLLYFQLTSHQIQCIYKSLLEELMAEMELKNADFSTVLDCQKNSIKLTDTFIDENYIFSGKEKGVFFALNFGGDKASLACASKVDLQGKHKICLKKVVEDIRKPFKKCPKGLLDSNATARMLFDKLALLIKTVIGRNCNDTINPCPVGVAVGFPIEQRAINEATLLRWTQGFATGRSTNDPAENMDLDALFERAFDRQNVSCKIAGITTDSVATLLAAAYENEKIALQCGVGFSINSGVNGCFIKRDGQTLKNMKGLIINCELGNFDKSLPVNDVDLEVDFGDETTEGKQIFEKMIGVEYIQEVCRRLVVKVWQSEAPQLAWVRNSISWKACVGIIEPQNEETLDMIDLILTELWDWQTNIEQRRAVRKLFSAVFQRAAALTAIAMVALSKQTGLLQPAMGGVTVAINGDIYRYCSYFRTNVKNYIKHILTEETCDLVHLIEVEDAVIKGAGIIAAISEKMSRS